MKKLRKYYLVEDLGNEDYKEIDSSFSLSTVKNRKLLQEKMYHKTNLKIMSLEK
jgi:hypothetical protein